MARSFARLAPALLPLAAGLVLLRSMPTAAGVEMTSPTILRLHPLALAAAVLLPLGAVRPQASFKRAVRLALGVTGAVLSVTITVPALQLAALYLVSLIVLRHIGVRWYVALAALSAGLLAPELGAALPSGATAAALVLAAFVGLGCVPRWTPLAGGEDWEPVLRPLWLFPLLQSLEAGPWPVGLALAAQLAGAVAAVAAAIEAFAAPDQARRYERMLASLLSMALVCVALNTAPGVAGALWALCAHGWLLLGMGRRDRQAAALLWLFVPVWWTAGASAAAGGFLAAAALLFAGILLALVSLLGRTTMTGQSAASTSLRPSAATPVAVAATAVLLMLFAPVVTRFVALPVIDQLGAGLTAFGLLEVWPWIGLGIQNAGHRRVAAVPGVALVPLLGVVAAGLWLLLRAVGRAAPVPLSLQAEQQTSPLDLVRDRVWWARTRRGG